MSQKSKALLQHVRGGPYSQAVQNAWGITAEIIAALCRVDIATARRWKSGKSRIPYAAQALIEGDLGAFSKHWQGWKIRNGEIISPDQWTISRNDALAVPLLIAQLKAKDVQIERAMAEVEQMKRWMQTQEQPAPDGVLPSIKHGLVVLAASLAMLHGSIGLARHVMGRDMDMTSTEVAIADPLM